MAPQYFSIVHLLYWVSSLIAVMAKSATAYHAQHLVGSSFGVPRNQSFDYIVIGGGTAGLAVATRLSEDPNVTVAIVEAGSFYEIGNSNYSQVPAYAGYWTGKDPDDVNPLVDWGFVTAPLAVYLHLDSV